MASQTPGRAGGAAGGKGYYADPSSPIASTPQRGKAATQRPPPTPASATLSPMRPPPERPLQRHVGGTAEEPKSWGAIFSPVLRFFQSDEEARASGQPGAIAGGPIQPQPQPPVLGAAPAARKAATTSSSHATSGGSPSSPTGALAQRTAALSMGGGSASSSLASPAGYRGAPSPSGVAARSPMSAAISSVSRPGAAAAAAAAAAQQQQQQQAAAAAAAAAASADEENYDYEYEEFNPYLFIKMLPPYHSVAPRVPRIVLPKKRVRAPDVSLILDLDETLVHCSVDPITDADVQFSVAFNGCEYQVYVRKRPHLDKFLQWIAGRFEVTIFTASQQVYAEKLLDLLDPEHKYIEHRLYRDSCLNVEGNYLKDLNVLGRDMSKTLLVDNSPHAFGYQLDNGVPIESWFDDRADTELLKLMRVLEEIHRASDVRTVLRERFGVWKLVQDASPPPHSSGY